MRSTMILAALVAILTLTTAPAMAEIEMSLQEILDDITQVTATNPTGMSSVNAATDMIPDWGDSYWNITATGGSVATMIIEIAGNKDSNTFGVYQMGSPASKVQIFSGLISPGGPAGLATLAMYEDGVGGFDVYVNSVLLGNWATSTFGYYLDGPGGTFYSDSLLNPQGMDHMLAYQGVGDTVKIANIPAAPWTANEFILAWEDVSAGADWDYNDLLVMVESVLPVPVPGAVLLGVLGLGAAGMRLRKRQS